MASEIKALAKINLFLHVLGKRADGHHILDSMVAFAEDLYDTITLEESTQDSVIQTHDSLYLVDGPNILEKTLHALRAIRKIPCFKVVLDKRIPIGAGLGGGSSDAAQLIAHLNTRLDLKLSDTELLHLCMSLGADVLPCLRQKASWFTGTGEAIEPINKFPEIYAVLAHPNTHIDTKTIYAMGFKNFHALLPRTQNFHSVKELLDTLKPQTNAFLPNASAYMPELHDIIAAIQATKSCSLARMSGSGSTCFGLFENKSDADNAKSYLQSVFPSYAIYSTLLA